MLSIKATWVALLVVFGMAGELPQQFKKIGAHYTDNGSQSQHLNLTHSRTTRTSPVHGRVRAVFERDFRS